jgi:chaperone modulatory protein CbpM
MADLSTPTAATRVIEEHVSFSVSALCHASGADLEQLQALVAEGLLQPTGDSPLDWRFLGHALPQTRKALRLARDLQLDVAAVVLVMDLLAEIDRLRSRLPAEAMP